MKRNKHLKVTAKGVWGFILSLLSMSMLPVDILALFLSGSGLIECAEGKKRGIGWPIAGLFFGIVYFINFIASWKAYADIDGFWQMNILMSLMLLLVYYIVRRETAKKDGTVPPAKPGGQYSPNNTQTGSTAASFAGNTAAGSGANTASGTKFGTPGPAKSAYASSGSGSSARPDAETVRKQVEEKTNALKEKLLEEEEARRREEEERERIRQKDASARKEFLAKILADAASEPPAEREVLTLDGQRLLYTYACGIFPPVPDSEAGKVLMRENIEDAETMIETVSGVMGDLSERILESDDGWLREHWDKLAEEDLIRGIKVFSFYKEMSVGSEPFELILDKLIDYLYEKETQRKTAGA